jgi:hypothetical protein
VPGPRQIVDAPTFTSSGFGLLSVVQTPGTGTSHWQNGVTWDSYCPENMGDTTYDECIATTGAPEGAVPEPSTKTANVERTTRGATPFTAYTRFDCSPVGNADAQRIAINALAQVEEWQVEYTFWTGLVDGRELAFPHLAADATVLDNDDIILQPTASTAVTGSPVDVATGLGRLEKALADCYGGRGVIHVPVDALPTLVAASLVLPVGGRDVSSGQFGRQLQTTAGNLVAVGGGYPGTGPDGTDPGSVTTWLYATGPVFMYRSDVQVHPFSSTVDRSNNTVQMIAERTYVLGFDCCLHAVQVELGIPN